MMPSMQIHLHETKSPDQLTRQYASNQLDLHMTVLTEMQKTYWTANMQHELFLRARTTTKTLKGASHSCPSQPIPTARRPAEEPLPFHYNNSMGTSWIPYLNMQVDVDLGFHQPSFAVDPSLDFFSPVPSMPVANAPNRARQQNDQIDSSYG